MKTNHYKKPLTQLTAAVFLFTLFSLSSPAAYAQGFLSLDNDLQTLEDLIKDTLANTIEQQKLLDGLKQNLNESGILITNYENIIQEQEKLLKDLQTRLYEMSET
jgi:hypothetical protein